VLYTHTMVFPNVIITKTLCTTSKKTQLKGSCKVSSFLLTILYFDDFYVYICISTPKPFHAYDNDILLLYEWSLISNNNFSFAHLAHRFFWNIINYFSPITTSQFCMEISPVELKVCSMFKYVRKTFFFFSISVRMWWIRLNHACDFSLSNDNFSISICFMV